MLGGEEGSSHLQHPPALKKKAAPSYLPSQVPCCIGEVAGQAVPATTATLCCSTFLSVNMALPTGHALEQMDNTRCTHQGWQVPSGILGLNGACLYEWMFLS